MNIFELLSESLVLFGRKKQKESVFSVIKSANEGVIELLRGKDEAAIQKHYQAFFEKVKDDFQGDFNQFMNACLMDLKFNMIGGGVF